VVSGQQTANNGQQSDGSWHRKLDRLICLQNCDPRPRSRSYRETDHRPLFTDHCLSWVGLSAGFGLTRQKLLKGFGPAQIGEFGVGLELFGRGVALLKGHAQVLDGAVDLTSVGAAVREGFTVHFGQCEDPVRRPGLKVSMSATGVYNAQAGLAARFRAVRERTLKLCEPLSAEDMMVQSTPEASPAKWHLAHTAWFFESFVLRPFLPGYRLFSEDFPWLFNSYYRSFAEFPEKRLRSSFSRPGLEEILRYRVAVDEGVDRLLADDPPTEALQRLELGVNHEEQHQELLLTDMLHAFFTNPLRPAYLPALAPEPAMETELKFKPFEGGLREAGCASAGFCFDNEQPRHRVWLEPYALAARLTTCGEFAEFIADGGYRRPELWLSAGWDAVEANGWQAPLYWTRTDDGWNLFTLRGELPLQRLKDAPVSQVSYFEADAYARWAGYRLATEFEWEAAAEDLAIEGNLLDSGRCLPAPAPTDPNQAHCLTQFYGDCWEWTASAYLGYPGYKPLPGSLGEYNGKFMSGQMVLRGGSCVTPAAHIRSSYRNFFPPETRWQFSGIRLAS
jgi:ergothioneine biosynthesis protein EgtB